MIRKLLITAIAAALLPAASGCIMFGFGPEDLRLAVSRAEGVSLTPEVCLSMDGLSVALAGALAGSPVPLHGIGWLDIGVYRVGGEHNVFDSKIHEMNLKGWDSLVRVRSKTENVHVLVDGKGDRVNGLVVVMREPEQIVIARIRGDLNRFFEEAMKSVVPTSGWVGVAGIFGAAGGIEMQRSTGDAAAPDATSDETESETPEDDSGDGAAKGLPVLLDDPCSPAL